MAALNTGGQKVRKNPQTTRWAQVRSQGKPRFLWYYGVLGVGVPVAIFKIVFDLAEKGSFPLLSLLLNIILFPIIGLLIGFLTWSISERRYQRRRQTRDSEQVTAKPSS